jgi:hypothetical protein
MNYLSIFGEMIEISFFFSSPLSEKATKIKNTPLPPSNWIHFLKLWLFQNYMGDKGEKTSHIFE